MSAMKTTIGLKPGEVNELIREGKFNELIDRLTQTTAAAAEQWWQKVVQEETSILRKDAYMECPISALPNNMRRCVEHFKKHKPKPISFNNGMWVIHAKGIKYGDFYIEIKRTKVYFNPVQLFEDDYEKLMWLEKDEEIYDSTMERMRAQFVNYDYRYIFLLSTPNS